MNESKKMSLLGLELNDVGIMVAASDPARLLPIDGRDTESPGIALVEKKGLTIGKAAERKAHLYPNLVNTWLVFGNPSSTSAKR
jgi:hypothetical protein